MLQGYIMRQADGRPSQMGAAWNMHTCRQAAAEPQAALHSTARGGSGCIEKGNPANSESTSLHPADPMQGPS